jgi:hypothetical protein
MSWSLAHGGGKDAADEVDVEIAGRSMKKRHTVARNRTGRIDG